MNNFIIYILLISVINHRHPYAERCTGESHIKESNGHATSPGYPDDYGSSSNCAFRFSAPEGQFIDVLFSDFKLEEDPDCRYDYVNIYDGDEPNPEYQIGKFCNEDDPPGQILSSSNNLYIQFVSDSSTEERGFEFLWNFHDQGCDRLTVRGFLYDQSINGNYTRTDETCDAGRPIYVQEEYPHYELFLEKAFWHIADQQFTCINTGIRYDAAFVRSSAILPDFITYPWEERDNEGNWVFIPTAGIDCGDPKAQKAGISTGAVAGISVACAVIAVVVPIVAVTIINKKAKAKTERCPYLENTMRVTPRTEPQQTIFRTSEPLPPTAPPFIISTNRILQQDGANVSPFQPAMENDLPPSYEEVVSPGGAQHYPTVDPYELPPYTFEGHSGPNGKHPPHPPVYEHIS